MNPPATDPQNRREVFVAIHGHFYQPPRENPWTGRIERQHSTSPYHDWNELVASQCYLPNSASRVLDTQMRIKTIVNNFEYISYNVGPTLFSWLQQHEIDAYRKIIKADEISRERNEGHGNAIAQAYNHPILPLSSLRDQRTQVEWGIRDFRKHFRRDPEGMWLPETAVNYTTLEVLHEKGITFTILSPTQAQRFRPLGGKAWTNCGDNSIAPFRPYRVFLRKGKGQADHDRWIDVFFYHWKLSVAASFEHLLTNGDRLTETLAKAAPEEPGPHLVFLATDGETLGHHEPFADMCMAYFFSQTAAKAGLRITNLAHYLEMYPPTHEAEINLGPDGDGSAWSCSHGLGRWKNDCGCATGGPQWWSQTWRAPMREAVRLLADRVDELFEREGGKICPDVWLARDDYIEVYDNPLSSSTAGLFLERHLKSDVAPARAIALLKLCRMQMFSQLAHTSCGWFFADISGLEANQNLKYAARALELAEEFGDKELREDFLAVLEKAVSNLPEHTNGREIFARAVKQSHFDGENMAACFAINRLVTGDAAMRNLDTFHFAVKDLRNDQLSDQYESTVGLVAIENRLYMEERLYAYFATRFTRRDVRCYLHMVEDMAEYEQLLESLRQIDKSQVATLFCSRYFSWADMVPDAAERIMDNLLAESLGNVHAAFERIYDSDKDLFQAYVETGLQLPDEAREIVRSTLSRLFAREVMAKRGLWRRDAFSDAASLLAEGKALGLELDKLRAEALLNEDLAAAGEELRQTKSSREIEKLVAIIDIAGMLGLKLHRYLAENLAMEYLLQRFSPERIAAEQLTPANRERLLKILDDLERLNIATDQFKAGLT